MRRCLICKKNLIYIRGRPRVSCLKHQREVKRMRDRMWSHDNRINNKGYKTHEYAIYRKRYPEKVKAQQMLYRARKKGLVKKLPCEVCGNSRVHAHHPNYNYPLSVIWLCPVHHKEAHK